MSKRISLVEKKRIKKGQGTKGGDEKLVGGDKGPKGRILITFACDFVRCSNRKGKKPVGQVLKRARTEIFEPLNIIDYHKFLKT